MAAKDKNIKELIRCFDCEHFDHYEAKGIKPLPEALGYCKREPWDAFTTQWPFLRHPCKAFTLLSRDGTAQP